MIQASQSWWETLPLSPLFANPGFWNTISLLVVIFATRVLVIRALEGKEKTLSDVRRRWISIVQNSSIVIIVLGLIFIWSPQLSTFALSLTAFAVATVIATKEYLLCIVGAVYRAASRPFTVGDWIEIQGMRGEVISEGILTTRLQELGNGLSRFEHTGRILTLPNSLLLTQTVFNESYRKKYLHYNFTVTVEPGIDPQPMLESSRTYLKKLMSESDHIAERYLSRVQQKLKTALPDHEPTIFLETSPLAKIQFGISIFCSISEAPLVQDKITQYILAQSSKADRPAKTK